MPIFIPKKIKVGYNERKDTYTKKLAYVIYFDEKGKLRKETSWEGWRDKKIEPDEYDNVPMSGFVLNKKVGDYSDGWNHRKSYCRVYDPRNFEVEVNIENLLYILENSSSIKGKGIEESLIYAWDGKDLFLMPVSSPDYQEITKFSNILNDNLTIKAKNLKLGAIYKTKDNKELVYLGKFDYYDSKYNRDLKKYEDGVNKGKHFYFRDMSDKFYSDSTEKFKNITGKLISIVDENCHEEYAKWVKALEDKAYFSPEDPEKDVWCDYTLEEFEKKINYIEGKYYCSTNIYDSNKIQRDIRKDNYGSNQQFYYYVKAKNPMWGGYYSSEPCYIGNTVEEMFNFLKPKYKKIYLKNGNFCRKEF